LFISEKGENYGKTLADVDTVFVAVCKAVNSRYVSGHSGDKITLCDLCKLLQPKIPEGNGFLR